jgi:hypothetical protein
MNRGALRISDKHSPIVDLEYNYQISVSDRRFPISAQTVR